MAEQKRKLTPAEKQKRQIAAMKGVHTRRVNERTKRVKEIISVLPDDKRYLAQDLANNFVWLSVQVEEAREALDKEGMVIPYDNGGGQKGIRQNPRLDVYHKLSQRYNDAYVKLLKSLPDDEEEAKDELEQFWSE